MNYTVNGVGYVATDPTRIDTDGDGYFIEVDPDDGDPASQPAPNGGCDEVYQYCGGVVVPDAPVVTSTKAGKRSVTLNWDNSQTVDYYNAYRAGVSGGPYTLVATNLLNESSSWKNTGLTSGVEYFYVMTSVVGGIESDYSNEVSEVPR